MSILIDHETFVISVSKSETVFVRTNPATGLEIRALDVNGFKLSIGAILDTEEGIVLPDVFIHNTEVTLSGVVYARTIEFIEPYSVTIENGNYAVQFYGANSNLEDVTNVNSVSIRPANSAGKQTIYSGSGLDSGQDAILTKLHQAHYNKRLWDKTNDIVTIYADDGNTVLYSFAVNDDLSSITPI